MCASIVPCVAFAKRIGSVQFADNRVVEVLVGVKAHCHHAPIAVARKYDRIAALNIVGNLRELVAEADPVRQVKADGDGGHHGQHIQIQVTGGFSRCLQGGEHFLEGKAGIFRVGVQHFEGFYP